MFLREMSILKKISYYESLNVQVVSCAEEAKKLWIVYSQKLQDSGSNP